MHTRGETQIKRESEREIGLWFTEKLGKKDRSRLPVVPRSVTTGVLDYWTEDMAVTGDETESAATGDMPTYQLCSPSTGLTQSIVIAASPGTMHCPSGQISEEVTRKREVRLMKNREAARECRRKKKEYVKCLENRVAVLENQNKTLIEELKALKDIYCHKAE